jgi:hypothetical protein
MQNKKQHKKLCSLSSAYTTTTEQEKDESIGRAKSGIFFTLIGTHALFIRLHIVAVTDPVPVSKT